MIALMLLGAGMLLLPGVVYRSKVADRAGTLDAKGYSKQGSRQWLTRLFPTFFPPSKPPDDAQGEALLHQMAGLLRAGMPVEVAWESLGVRTVEDGLPKDTDLVRVLDANPTPDTFRQAQGVVVACKLAHELGIPLAQLLIVVAGTVEDSQRSIAQREQALAGPAATGRVLIMLPVIGVVLGALLGAQPLNWLLGEPAGWLCLAAGVVLLIVGRQWTAHLMRKAITAGTAP